ncbi:hypothetical protein [Hyalangium versicolor]|uniref:hypothetical protein n=1 Tax=Hyalangium versicolor TaxID=2861190 RepID=UPI001CCDB6CF|nr:hypothetical protein [Hyalangium versicolor]
MRAVQVLPVLLLTLVAACSGVQTAEDPSKPPPPKTTVEIRNHKQLDFTVYVMNETTRIRLGMVPAMSSRTFTIPSHLVIDQGRLRFQADPIGSNEVASTNEELLVHAGEAFSLTIQ